MVVVGFLLKGEEKEEEKSESEFFLIFSAFQGEKKKGKKEIEKLRILTVGEEVHVLEVLEGDVVPVVVLFFLGKKKGKKERKKGEENVSAKKENRVFSFPAEEEEEQQAKSSSDQNQHASLLHSRVPPVDRDQVALDVRVLRRELRHGLERGTLDQGQPCVAVLDAVRGGGGRAEPGLGARGVGVLPEVEHDDFRVGVGLILFF